MSWGTLAWVEIYDQKLLLAKDFAMASGISGVDLAARATVLAPAV